MNCPHCNAPLSTVTIADLKGRTGSMSWNCIGYGCPSCNKVLSVAIDPVALKTDMVAEVAREVARALRP